MKLEFEFDENEDAEKVVSRFEVLDYIARTKDKKTLELFYALTRSLPKTAKRGRTEAEKNQHSKIYG